MSAAVVPAWANTTQQIWMAGLYGYKMSFDLAWMALGLYSAVAAVHLALNVASPRARRIWWMYLPVLTAGMEAVGYYYRVVSAEHVTADPVTRRPKANLGEVIASFVLTLVPPIILAVVNYEVVGKVMRAAGVSVGWLDASRVTRTFLLLDILSFVIQCGAVPLLTSGDPDKADNGSKIVLTGLVLQFALFAAFVWVSLTVRALPAVQKAGALVRDVVFVCLLTIFMLLVRNGYRLYEYSRSYAFHHDFPGKFMDNSEAEFYALELGPVWAVHVIFAVFNFGRMLPGDDELAAICRKGAEGAEGDAAAPTTSALAGLELRAADGAKGGSE